MPSLPDGYATHDLIVFGDRLHAGAFLARGMSLTFPDIRRADNATKIQRRQQALAALASLGADFAVQFQWSVDADYRAVLADYEAASEKDAKNSWPEYVRRERLERSRRLMDSNELRRERLTLFLARRCGNLTREDAHSAVRMHGYLAQQSRLLGERLEHIAQLFPSAVSHLFGDSDHCSQYLDWLNPSLPAGRGTGRFWRRERSLIENTFLGDGVPFRARREGLVGLYFDDHYHALFVVREWPKQTEPGMIHVLTDAIRGNGAITINLHPCDVQAEISALEHERSELMKQCDDPKKFHLKSEVERKARRIASLMEGTALPFKALMIVRVWARTAEALGESCLAVKSAFQHWNGCQYHQVNQEAQARHLFFETFPGWLGGRTRGWDCDAESSYLADLLPLSSSFTGHLDQAELLLEGRERGLVGMRLFSHGTPQHACLVGMRGAGKSSVTMEVLSQTESQSGFTGIVEEGLSYGTYAQINGYQSLILKPGAPLTWNYFDTQGLPLSPAHLADAAALLVKLAGVSNSDDGNKLRAAVMTEYLNRLYETAAEDWLLEDSERAYHLSRKALAMMRWSEKRGASGAGIQDAFVEWREATSESSRFHDEALSTEAALSDQAITAFMKDRSTSGIVRALVFSELRSDAFPTHQAFCSILRSGRFAHHRSGDIARELDLLATLLTKWKSVGGLYGPLVDGATNIEFGGKGLHVELGYLGETNTELKEVAGFLATSKMRQRVVGMSRTVRKRLVYEEVAKFLTVPNASAILAENYAQFRKYRCWVLTVFQNAEQLNRVDPALLRTIRANSTQFWFMRHQDSESLASMGDAIGLPHAARTDILGYPLPEHQRREPRAAYFTLFGKEGAVPVCGSVAVRASEAMRYVADSSGEVFEGRTRRLANERDPVRAIIQEVGKPKIAA